MSDYQTFGLSTHNRNNYNINLRYIARSWYRHPTYEG